MKNSQNKIEDGLVIFHKKKQKGHNRKLTLKTFSQNDSNLNVNKNFNFLKPSSKNMNNYEPSALPDYDEIFLNIKGFETTLLRGKQKLV